MVPKIPNLTFDTSCIIPLLESSGDQTAAEEIDALEKIKTANDLGKLKIWISQKSVNEAILNLENAEGDQDRIKKWLSTLQLLGEFDKTKSIWILDVSKLGIDTILASDEQSEEYPQIKKILIGNKTNVKLGDIFDIVILYEHRLQRNELFVVRDDRMFRKTAVDKLFDEFEIRIVTPKIAIEILKTEYSIQF